MNEHNKTGMSQVSAISKAQKYSMNNYWKHLEFFFQKKVFWKKKFKKYFLKKVGQCRKTQKRAFRLIQRFYKPKTSKKNARGYPLIDFENFRKKSHSAEKTQRGDPLVSPLHLEA